jgi:hypothetical protein
MGTMAGRVLEYQRRCGDGLSWRAVLLRDRGRLRMIGRMRMDHIPGRTRDWRDRKTLESKKVNKKLMGWRIRRKRVESTYMARRNETDCSLFDRWM